MPKEKTQSYRLWTRAIKELRKVEKEYDLEKNISKTILFMREHLNNPLWVAAEESKKGRG